MITYYFIIDDNMKLIVVYRKGGEERTKMKNTVSNSIVEKHRSILHVIISNWFLMYILSTVTRYSVRIDYFYSRISNEIYVISGNIKCHLVLTHFSFSVRLDWTNRAIEFVHFKCLLDGEIISNSKHIIRKIKNAPK